MSTLPNLALPVPQTPGGTQATNHCEPRFTRDGSDAFERHLTLTCERIRTAVESVIPAHQLEAILLGGGYGRGEGGVLRSEQGDLPYNDLEFYVCVSGNRFVNRWRYGERLHRLGEKLSSEAGVEVEFQVISIAYLQSTSISMFSYDLVEGHRWLRGHEELLRHCEHHRQAGQIPLAEATRLLMNRFSGLLFAGARMDQKRMTEDDADFIGRNLAKTQLALGDAVLSAVGEYHWSCVTRHERFLHVEVPELAPWMDALRLHHAAGLKFKLHPIRHAANHSHLRPRFEDLRILGATVWLWLENRRLSQMFSSTRDYAYSPINKCPESAVWKNLLLNLRAIAGGRGPGSHPFRDPRERLLCALPLLLWEPVEERGTVLRRVQRELRCLDTTQHGLLRSYRDLWQRLK